MLDSNITIMTKMTTSVQGKTLIKLFESLKLQAYICPAGKPTIGYGHTKGVKMGMVITEERANELLTEDCRECEKVLNALGVNFAQNQFDALVAWLFNIGETKFKTSSLRRKILADAEDIEIADQMIRWIYSGGKELMGLKRRRVAEANRFMGRDVYFINSKGKIVKR